MTTEGKQFTTTAVTAGKVFGPILDVGEHGIIEQNIRKQDLAIGTAQSATTEGKQSTTTEVTARSVLDPILDVGEHGTTDAMTMSIERNIRKQDLTAETVQDATTEEKQSMTTGVTARSVLGPIINVGEHEIADAATMNIAITRRPELTSDRTTTDVSLPPYGEEKEGERPNADVEGGEVRATNAVARGPTTANSTTIHAATTINPTVTIAKAAWMLESDIGEVETPARNERSIDQHSILVFFSMLLMMAGIGLALCILSCGVGLTKGALHIRVSERDEV